ncbi:hypothetical protein Bbelb_385030 [Branchiostoma belcheri]|nr:hypothetical protein Bbelb_385030 [Branchiostoma belcheri]
MTQCEACAEACWRLDEACTIQRPVLTPARGYDSVRGLCRGLLEARRGLYRVSCQVSPSGLTRQTDQDIIMTRTPSELLRVSQQNYNTNWQLLVGRPLAAPHAQIRNLTSFSPLPSRELTSGWVCHLIPDVMGPTVTPGQAARFIRRLPMFAEDSAVTQREYRKGKSSHYRTNGTPGNYRQEKATQRNQLTTEQMSLTSQ